MYPLMSSILNNKDPSLLSVLLFLTEYFRECLIGIATLLVVAKVFLPFSNKLVESRQLLVKSTSQERNLVASAAKN